MFLEYLLFLIFGVICVYAVHKWATINKDYFVIRKIKALKPVFLFGNTGGLFTKQYRPIDFMDSIYYELPNEKYVYSFNFL